MHGAWNNNSLILGPQSSPVDGTERWDPVRSIWNGGMLVATIVLGPLFFSWSALAFGFGVGCATFMVGYCIGYHRLLVHRSFKCRKWVEHTLVWLGALIGMGGPIWTIHGHDIRDWAQRQPHCHDFLAHRGGMLRDAWRFLHCRLVLHHPPLGFDPGPRINNDRVHQFLERTWMWHQLPIGVALFLLGGWAWVVWGVFFRVALVNTLNWFFTYVAHVHGNQSWLVEGAGVQGHDLPWAAIISFGEGYHNNHHAFPGSARYGLYPGQLDPCYWVIQSLAFLGLVWDVQTPATLPPRPNLVPLRPDAASILRGRVVRAEGEPGTIG